MLRISSRSLLHNLGVVAVGFGVAFLGKESDALLGSSDLQSALAALVRAPLLAIGFFLRGWAPFYFYE